MAPVSHAPDRKCPYASAKGDGTSASPCTPFLCANAPGSRNRCNAGDTRPSSYASRSSTLECICRYTHEPAGGRQTKL